MRTLDYIILLLLTGTALFYLVKKNRKKPVTRRRRRSDSQLNRREQGAWRALQARGYRMAEIHPSVTVSLKVEQKAKDYTYEGDFIVSKRNQSHLVRVKRGDTSPLSASLRQELILQQLLFQTDGVFLYDSEKERLQEITLSYASAGGGEDKAAKGDQALWQAALFMLIIAGLVLLYRLFF